MKRVDWNTIELNELEQVAKSFFEDLLSEGQNTIKAAKTVRAAYGEMLSKEFYEYLTDNIPMEKWDEVGACYNCGAATAPGVSHDCSAFKPKDEVETPKFYWE